MSYRVNIISDAEEDLFSIYKYVSVFDSAAKAEKLLTGLEETCLSLQNMPEKGYIPHELDRIGVQMYREIHFKPYRIIYQIIKKDVYIHCILDGRRDLMDLLRERLLR